MFFPWPGQKPICPFFGGLINKVKTWLSNFFGPRADGQSHNFFGIGLIKIYLIGSMVPVIENWKKCYITLPHYYPPCKKCRRPPEKRKFVVSNDDIGPPLLRPIVYCFFPLDEKTKYIKQSVACFFIFLLFWQLLKTKIECNNCVKIFCLLSKQCFKEIISCTVFQMSILTLYIHTGSCFWNNWCPPLIVLYGMWQHTYQNCLYIYSVLLLNQRDRLSRIVASFE